MADIWVNILGDASKLKGALGNAEGHVSNFSEKIGKVGRVATIAGGAVTAAFTGIVVKTAQAGDQFDKMSLRTGVSVENLSSLAYAAGICGTDIGTVENSLRFLVRGMDDTSKGVGESKDAFEKLGISVVDEEGNLRDTVDVMKEAATAISNMENETEQIAVATDIFGSRYGTQLLPLLKSGGEGIEELMNRAKELGITMSTEAATKAAEFTDRMTDLKGSLAGVGRTIGDTLIPAITPLIEKVTEIVGKVLDWKEANPELFETIVTVAAKIGAVAAVGGPILMAISALSKMGAILTLPAGAVVAAIVGLIVIWKNWDEIVEYVGGWVEKIKTFFTDLIDKIIGKIQPFIDFIIESFERLNKLIDWVKGWGKKITEGLANGLTEGNPRVDKAMSEVTETVAKHVRSRSPVRYGVLKDMRVWGYNLMEEYALGLYDGVSNLDLVLKYTGEEMEDEVSEWEEIFNNFKNNMESGLSNAFYSVLSGAKTFGEAMKDLWKNMIDAILQQIAKLAASWIVNLIFPGGGLGLGILGLNKGGGVGYQFGGEVKKYQFGGLADTVMAKLDIGEYVISRPMTDFIRKFKAIPQNLIEAVSRGLPTPVPAFAGGGPVVTPNITTSSFGEIKINIDIHDNRISDNVDIKRLAVTISNEVLRKIELKRRH